MTLSRMDSEFFEADQLDADDVYVDTNLLQTMMTPGNETNRHNEKTVLLRSQRCNRLRCDRCHETVEQGSAAN